MTVQYPTALHLAVICIGTSNHFRAERDRPDASSCKAAFSCECRLYATAGQSTTKAKSMNAAAFAGMFAYQRLPFEPNSHASVSSVLRTASSQYVVGGGKRISKLVAARPDVNVYMSEALKRPEKSITCLLAPM